MALQEMRVDDVDEILDAVLVRRNGDAEFMTDRRQQLGDGELGIEDVGHIAVFRQLFQKTAANRGFSRTDGSGQQDEATFAAYAVEQMCQGFLMPLAQVEIARIGRDREGCFGELEVLEVHRRRIASSGDGIRWILYR